MGSITYTYYGTSGGDWDTTTNWNSPPPEVNDATTLTESFLFSLGSSPITVFYSDSATPDSVYDLTINNVNYTVTAYQGNSLNVQDGIAINAGTLDLGEGGELSFQAANPGETQTFVLDGVMEGEGVIDSQDPTITGTGTIIAQDLGDGNAFQIQNALGASSADTLQLQVQAGAIAELYSSVASAVSISIAAGGVVQLKDLPGFQGTVAGLTVATGPNASVPPGTNYLDLTGVTLSNISSVSFNNGTITITDSTDGSGSIVLSGSSYAGDFVNYAADINGGTDIWIDDTVCFAAGTHILTPEGNVPVEAITAGDNVIAVVDGQRVARPVKWVGYRKLALDRHPKASGLAPVRVKRGAIAEGLPARDLLVSPPHCMFIDGKLVPAKLLVNDMTIVRDTALKSVEYYHIELDNHAVLIAEGVESESYLDTGNRAFFSNAGLAMILHPEFHLNAGLRCWETDACAPLAISPAAVLPIWRPLVDRAIALGFVPPVHATTTEADIHLVADGRRIDTIATQAGVHSFMVPAGVSSLAIASRSVVPNVLARYLDDPRRIGVAVRSVTIRRVADRAEFSADHPALSRGWHAPERADGALWRWTDGYAALPLGVVAGPVVVDVMVSQTTTYLIEGEKAEGRLAA